MIPDKKYREIAETLLQRSQKNEVNWVRECLHHDTYRYLVKLPQSQIAIAYHSPRTEPDFILMKLTREDGMEVGTLVVEEGDPDWELFRSLHAEAVRTVTGWDKVISDIEKAFSSQGVIGVAVTIEPEPATQEP